MRDVLELERPVGVSESDVMACMDALSDALEVAKKRRDAINTAAKELLTAHDCKDEARISHAIKQARSLIELEART